MRISKKVQYGLMFTFYVSEKGMTRLGDAAEELAIPSVFLEQIAGKLRSAGVLKAKKGPGGGFVVNGDPTIGQVFEALDTHNLLTTEEVTRGATGHHAEKAVVYMATNLSSAINIVMKRKIRNLSAELIMNEASTTESRKYANVTDKRMN